jgi:hypothetical protein
MIYHHEFLSKRRLKSSKACIHAKLPVHNITRELGRFHSAYAYMFTQLCRCLIYVEAQVNCDWLDQ